MNGDRPPRPDSYTIVYWIFNWKIIKEELMGLFNEFPETGMFVKVLNTTFMVFIPKKGDAAENIKYYRPISLVGSIYKILLKVLANRMKRVTKK